MPALVDITFTALTTDATPPVYNGGGVWTLYSPLSPDTAAASSTTALQLHHNVTVPDDHCFAVFPYSNDDLPGTSNTTVQCAFYEGIGTPKELYVNMLNHTGSGQTPTAEVAIAYLIVFPKSEFLFSQA